MVRQKLDGVSPASRAARMSRWVCQPADTLSSQSRDGSRSWVSVKQHLVAALLELDADFRRFTVAVLPLIGEKVRRLAGGDGAEDAALAVIAGIFRRRQIVLVGKAGVVDRYLDATADDGLDLAAADPQAALVGVDEIVPDAADRAGQQPLDAHGVARDEFAVGVHGFFSFLLPRFSLPAGG